MSKKTMTLRKVVDTVLEDKTPEAPQDALVSGLAILRTIDQREKATDDGIAGSLLEWRRQHGEETPDKVRDWFASLGPKLMDAPLDPDFILDTLSPEED